jgi:hypothetical protein
MRRRDKHEWSVGNDLEGGGHALFQILFWNLPAENRENTKSRYRVM